MGSLKCLGLITFCPKAIPKDRRKTVRGRGDIIDSMSFNRRRHQVPVLRMVLAFPAHRTLERGKIADTDRKYP